MPKAGPTVAPGILGRRLDRIGPAPAYRRPRGASDLRLRPSVREERELQPGRTVEPGIHGVPGRSRRVGEELGAGVDQDLSRGGGIADLEAHPNMASDPTPDLYL